MSALSLISFIVIIYSFCIEKYLFLHNRITKGLIFSILLAFSIQSVMYTDVLLSPFGLLVPLVPLFYGFSVITNNQNDRNDIVYIALSLILIRNSDSSSFYLFLLLSKAIVTTLQNLDERDLRFNYLKNSIVDFFLILICFLSSIFISDNNQSLIIPLLLGYFFYTRTCELRFYESLETFKISNILKKFFTLLLIPCLILYKIFNVENALSFMVLDDVKCIYMVFYLSVLLYLITLGKKVSASIYSTLLLSYLYLYRVISFEIMIALDILSFFAHYLCKRISNNAIKNCIKALFLVTPISPFFYLVGARIKELNLTSIDLFGVLVLYVLVIINVVSSPDPRPSIIKNINLKDKLTQLLLGALSIIVVKYLYDTI